MTRGSATSVRDLLGALVAFPTVAGTPNGELIAFAAERLQHAGAQVTVSTAARPDGQNLHAVLGPPVAGGLVLSAHTDVVAVEGQEWSDDPFRVRARDGRLYGRGTADMKGFIAAVLAAVADAEPAGWRRPLHVVLSSDEEIGCRGIRPLLPQLAEDIPAPWVTVVGEPTSLRVVERHKGKLALRIDVRGRAAHSSQAPQAVNAVEYAARLIVALRELGEQLAAAERDERFPVPHGTVSTGPVRGGVSLNIVPDECTFEVELRALPGHDPAALREQVVARARALEDEMRSIDPRCAIEVTTTTEYPGLAPFDGGAAAAQIAALAGTEAGGAVDFGTEAGLLQRALGAPVVVCGPGDMAQGHRPDEYVSEHQLHDAVAFVRRLLDTLRAPAAA